MKFTALLLFALLGWTGVGAAGIVLSLARGRRSEAIKHAFWLFGVLGAYLIALLAVSFFEPQKTVPVGQAQCFDQICFTVVSAAESPGLVAGDSGRVIRVAVRVLNRASSAGNDEAIHAYLVDSRGRVWEPLPGLSGNRLTARVAGRSQMLSQPMFRAAGDATSLGLVFTHGNWQWRRFVLGDSDSFGHRRTVVPLGELAFTSGPQTPG